MEPIPVATARNVAAQHGRDVVVIVTWSRAANRMDTITYGRSANDKVTAAKLGEILTNAAGAGPPEATHEDFRERTAAQWAQEKDRLTRALKLAYHTLSSLRAVREGIPDASLDEYIQFIRAAIDEATMAGTPREGEDRDGR